MSAVLAKDYRVIPGAVIGAWNFSQVRATLVRLWLPIALSVLLHLLALGWLHQTLLREKPGQPEAGLEEGLKVSLLDANAPPGASVALNAATPRSTASLPGNSPEQAQFSSDSAQHAQASLQKPVTLAAPAHPQQQADGAATVTEGPASPNNHAPGSAPQAANGAKGSFDAGYLPSTSVERAPIPLTQPDLESLADVPRPHAKIQLRAYVDQSGLVNQVVVVASQPDDQATALALAKVYKQVVYIAAYDHGRQVPSKIDFTIMLSSSMLPGDRPESPILRKSHL